MGRTPEIRSTAKSEETRRGVNDQAKPVQRIQGIDHALLKDADRNIKRFKRVIGKWIGSGRVLREYRDKPGTVAITNDLVERNLFIWNAGGGEKKQYAGF